MRKAECATTVGAEADDLRRTRRASDATTIAAPTHQPCLHLSLYAAGVTDHTPAPPRPIDAIADQIKGDGGICCTGPTEDFSRPERMRWSVPDGVETFVTWSETTTVYHRGVPGHHLQVAQNAYRFDLLNWRGARCAPASGRRSTSSSSTPTPSTSAASGSTACVTR